METSGKFQFWDLCFMDMASLCQQIPWKDQSDKNWSYLCMSVCPNPHICILFNIIKKY